MINDWESDFAVTLYYWQRKLSSIYGSFGLRGLTRKGEKN